MRGPQAHCHDDNMSASLPSRIQLRLQAEQASVQIFIFCFINRGVSGKPQRIPPFVMFSVNECSSTNLNDR